MKPLGGGGGVPHLMPPSEPLARTGASSAQPVSAVNAAIVPSTLGRFCIRLAVIAVAPRLTLSPPPGLKNHHLPQIAKFWSSTLSPMAPTKSAPPGLLTLEAMPNQCVV